MNTAGQALNREDASADVRVGARLPPLRWYTLRRLLGGSINSKIDLVTGRATMNNTMLFAGLKSGEIDLGIGRMSIWNNGRFKLRTAVLESL